MHYNINKVPNDAKKYNIKIAERGFGQTYYLRQKYLLQLGFNIYSIGFDFWLTAIRIYLKNRQISMMTLYNEIAKITNKKSSQVERAMRKSSENAKEKIKELYQYDGKLNNRTILNLLINFEMKG